MIHSNKISKSNYVRVEGSVKKAVEISRNRLVIVGVMFILCFMAIALRLINLGLADSNLVKNHKTDVIHKTLALKRKNITDRNGEILATNLKTASLYVNPQKIFDIHKAAYGINKVLPELNYDSLVKKLSSNGKSFIWIKRNLHPDEQDAILDLGIPALDFREEEKRTYPHGSLASHLLGFVGIDGEGLSGAEKEFNKTLVFNTSLKDSVENSSQNDDSLHLSIDIRLQNILHTEMVKKYEEHKASGAAGIIMDVNTSEVLAMVSLPDFNPNLPSKVNIKNTFNRATLGIYEMGSTFKTFTMAMAIDSGLISLGDSFDARHPISISGYKIRDHHGKKRWLTVPEIYMHSSNIGAAKMADKIGGKIQKEFLANLGMLDGSRIELPETSLPLYPADWGRVSTMTISYGHGIAVSPIHVITAVSALINGGIYREPTLIKDNVDEGIKVIQPETSDVMRRLMRLVVAKGTGRNADAKGYFVGGKTGTAEKVGVGKYKDKDLISSFIAAFPMNDPKYAILVVMDEPKGNKASYGYATAGWTAAPVVKEVIKQIAPILGVKPIDETSPYLRDTFNIDYKPKARKIASLFN